MNDVLNDTFEAGLDRNPTHGYIRWDLTDTPLWYLHNTTPNYQYRNAHFISGSTSPPLQS